MRFSVRLDAGEGFFRVEDRILRGIFRNGSRSDVVALLLRHFVEHPPELLWMQQRWMKPIGEGWPDDDPIPTPEAPDVEEELPL